VFDVRELDERAFARVDEALPLSRFTGWRADATYLVGWDHGSPIGHVHLAWEGTELEVPELQDLYVLPDRRGEGLGTALTEAAERLVADRGHEHCSVSVSETNEGARRLYERLGYLRAPIPPKRIRGTITIRGEPFDVDDTLLYFTKRVYSRR
jgi:GNAT superfamily N-acetyltransferase